MTRPIHRQLLSLAIAAAAMAIVVPPLNAYLKLGTPVGNTTVTLQWKTMPARYYVTNTGVQNVSPDQFRAAIDASFSTWAQVPTSTFSATDAGFTSARPFDDDGASVLGFDNRPDLDRVLGATTFIINTLTGEIVESDIFFNSAFPWSTSSAGETGRYDLQSIATHEIGHFQGLGHSALGETELRSGGGRRVIASGAVMFPIAFSAGNIVGRTLQPDDIAGVSDIYPDQNFRGTTGTISGRVTKNGQGVYGAHVIALSLTTGKMIANFSLDSSGTFAIAGLEPGAYAVRAEPLDDADIDSFFDQPPNVDLNFKPTFYTGVVVAPRGGSAGNIEVKVDPK